MKNVLIIYDTQFGNTKKLGHEIATGIQETGEITCTVVSDGEMETQDISTYQAVLFGGPTRAFRATRGALNAIKTAGKIGLSGKVVSTFGTYIMGGQSRGVKSMDKLLKKVADGAKVISPGFSGKVDSVRGPINEAEIPRAQEFGRKLGQEILQ